MITKGEVADILLGVAIGMVASYSMLFVFLYWVGAI